MDINKRQVPAKLYKYLEPARVDVLANSQVRYTPLGGFNDPFEGWPEITSLGSQADFSEVFDQVMPDEITRAYAQLDPRARAMLPLDVWSKMVRDVALEKQPQMFAQVQDLIPHAGKWMRSKYDQYIGAFCLSEIPDSLLMWSHYASSHAGFLVEYDTHHPHFHEQVSAEDELRHLRRVLYREARPSMPAAELNTPALFLTKSGHWSYEREWRLLRALQDADHVPQVEPAVHLFNFPPEAVTAVILGCRCTPQTTSAVREALGSNPGYGRAVLRRATPDSTHFLLRIVDETAS